MTKLDALNNAKEEIKRADHLIFVSLKYTRTVDVLKSVIERLISTFDCCITAILEYLKEKKKIDSLPKSPGSRVEIIRDKLDDQKIIEFIDFYSVLKKITRAKFTKHSEFRRHVTMLAEVDGKEVEVNLDIIHEYYKKTKEFITIVEELIC